MPDYVVIGHVTRDLMPDGSYRAGGTATYSALAALGLGLRVGMVTSAAPADTPAAAGIAVALRPAARTTTFENIYTQGTRRQFCRTMAAPLEAADVPEAWFGARILHLGPVAGEVVPGVIARTRGALVGVTPQGWLRRFAPDGSVHPTDWPAAEAALGDADAIILSADDLARDGARIEDWARWARLLVVTVGKEGAIIYHGGRQRRSPAFAVTEVDPTGAGDVFAAAFLVRLSETEDACEAAHYANCAASFVVEGIGAARIPTRDDIAWRLRHGRRRQ